MELFNLCILRYNATNKNIQKELCNNSSQLQKQLIYIETRGNAGKHFLTEKKINNNHLFKTILFTEIILICNTFRY